MVQHGLCTLRREADMARRAVQEGVREPAAGEAASVQAVTGHMSQNPSRARQASESLEGGQELDILKLWVIFLTVGKQLKYEKGNMRLKHVVLNWN